MQNLPRARMQYPPRARDLRVKVFPSKHEKEIDIPLVSRLHIGRCGNFRLF